METILICPQRLRQFGSSKDINFCLVTNSSLVNQFQIAEDSDYASTKIVPYNAERSFEQLLDESIPEPAHVLVISPQYFFESPAPEKLGQRKLVVMPCNSTPTPLLAIQHFLGNHGAHRP